MKKNILAVFIALSIASCSNEEDAPEKTSEINTNTNKVEASFGNSFLQPNKTSRKPVDRGDNIPVSINQITVDVNHNSNGITDTQTVFDLLPDGTPGNESKFYIDDVSAGTNTFTAKATTTGLAENLAETHPDTNASSVFTSLKSATVYANYIAQTSAQINYNTPQSVSFDMGTSNGRLNTYVYTGPTITSENIKVIITKQRFRADKTAIDATPEIYDITGSQSLVCAWNDDDATADNYVVLDIAVYDQANPTIIVFNDTRTITIKSSTTRNTTIAITKNGITTSENDATFNFPEWIVEGN